MTVSALVLPVLVLVPRTLSPTLNTIPLRPASIDEEPPPARLELLGLLAG